MTDPRGPSWRRTQDGHKCGWPGCENVVAGRLWGCREHWTLVPVELRDAWMAAGAGRAGPRRPIYERPAIKFVHNEIIEAIGCLT